MLLTISTSHQPASELGFLLHKHPERMQTFSLSYGDCHIFYPEASDSKCTMAMLLDVDPVGMTCSRKKQNQKFALAGYVNDRPYVVSSFMSTAISKVLGSAMAGTCKSHPELAQTAIPLEVEINVLPARGGEDFLRKLFEPLGYEVEATNRPLDEKFPEWGEGHYFSVRLSQTVTVSQMLQHLYVLIPVFDNQKHYFTSHDELQKLLDKGAGWLESHPEREVIVYRYLKFMPSLARQALAQLDELLESESETDDEEDQAVEAEPRHEEKIKLHDQRLDLVHQQLVRSGAERVIDLGCGEGKLIRRLIKDFQFRKIVGMDVAIRSLEIASQRLRLDELPSFQSERVKLIHGSLMYRDSRLSDFDAAALVEVIEHLDPPRLSALERVVFRHARPGTVVITTPNAEYNVMWPDLPAGKLRHSDHRFEWTRAEFESWAQTICERFGYEVELMPVGSIDEQVGAPSQMGVFKIARANAVTIESKQIGSETGSPVEGSE